MLDLTCMKPSEYLNQLLEEKRLNQRELADKMGVHINTVNYWLNGHRKPRETQLQSLADILGRPYEEVWRNLFPEQARKIGGKIPPGMVVKESLPVIGKANAGKNDIDWDDAGYPVGEGYDRVVRPENLNDPNAYAVDVVGDSMGIFEGWRLIVSPNKPVLNNDFVIAKSADGTPLFKTVTLKNDHVILTSINPKYEPVMILKPDLQILHKVWSLTQL